MPETKPPNPDSVEAPVTFPPGWVQKNMVDSVAPALGGEEARLLSKLLSLLTRIPKSPIPLEVALWNSTTIGEFLNRDSAVVRERIATLPSFPKAIRLPSKRGLSHPLYKAVEVIAWANKFKEKH